MVGFIAPEDRGDYIDTVICPCVTPAKRPDVWSRADALIDDFGRWDFPVMMLLGYAASEGLFEVYAHRLERICAASSGLDGRAWEKITACYRSLHAYELAPFDGAADRGS